MTAYKEAQQRRVALALAEERSRFLTLIFHHFWQQDEVHSTPSLGLEFPLVERIMTRHVGTIEVESEVGVGECLLRDTPC